jgi:arginyl-tRNA synthetase
MIEFFKPYIGEFITGFLALALGWLGKSQTQKKADNADLTAKIQAVYKEMVEDADKSMDLLREKVKLLEEKQKLQNHQWQKKLEEIEKTWQTKYSRLQTKYNSLLKKLEAYEKGH